MDVCNVFSYLGCGAESNQRNPGLDVLGNPEPAFVISFDREVEKKKWS